MSESVDREDHPLAPHPEDLAREHRELHSLHRMKFALLELLAAREAVLGAETFNVKSQDIRYIIELFTGTR